MSDAPAAPVVRHIVRSIADLPAGAWDRHVAGDHPFRGAAFLAAIEAAFPERSYAYLHLERAGETVGLAALTMEGYDLAFLLPEGPAGAVRWVRRFWPGFMTLRLAMVGTMETAMQHWWWDAQRLEADAFAEHLIAACDEALPGNRLLIVRDFMAGIPADAALLAALAERGFRTAANLPLAVVELPEGGIDAHLRRLRGKPKAAIRKQLREVERLGLRFDRVEDYEHLIAECWPLYLQVHGAAREFKRAPLPEAFFREVARRLRGRSTLLTVRTPEGELVGCILSGLSETVSNPFLIGLDYDRAKEMGLYYNLIWSEIQDAAERGRRTVDLGVTSYFIKQTMGAAIEPLTMAARVSVPWLRPLLGPLLPALLAEEQPTLRRAYRNDAADN